MKNNRIWIFIILALTNLAALAQNTEIKFEETNYKFGSIREEEGKITHNFIFTNTSNQPVRVNSVKASCGCTTPAWTKEEVQPGEKGSVTAEFNPGNRPGPFKKSLTVKSTAGDIVLYIEGHVMPKSGTPSDDFPSLSGNLRSKSKTFNFGKITTKEAVTKSFPIYNDGDTPVSFLDGNKTPAYIEVNIQPATLSPKQQGEIIITFAPQAKEALGFSIDNLFLLTDDKLEPEKNFSLMATVQEYFEPLTNSQYALSPQVVFDEKINDLGDIMQGEVVTSEFTITNAGQKTLILRKIDTNCGCTVAKIDKNDIIPGESIQLKVAFDSGSRKGTQHKTIIVYSNDPRNSVTLLTVKSSVKVPNQ